MMMMVATMRVSGGALVLRRSSRSRFAYPAIDVLQLEATCLAHLRRIVGMCGAQIVVMRALLDDDAYKRAFGRRLKSPAARRPRIEPAIAAESAREGCQQKMCSFVCSPKHDVRGGREIEAIILQRPIGSNELGTVAARRILVEAILRVFG